ncbi:MAG: hypothetical protein NC124_19780 [Clostridium sp.]|nr:hypothetical protein [Clostridium sp.]
MVCTEAEFVEQIMIDLVSQGYYGNDLLEHFREEVNQIQPAVEAMLAEVKRVAASGSEYDSYEDVFGREEKER